MAKLMLILLMVVDQLPRAKALLTQNMGTDITIKRFLLENILCLAASCKAFL
jgi:hypothetical protein